MTPTKTLKSPAAVEHPLFDFDEHHAKAERAREALAQSVAAEQGANDAHQRAVDHLTEMEDQLGTGTVSPQEYLQAQTAVTIAERVLKAASTRVRSALRTVPSEDVELAEAVAKSVRDLVHAILPVYALPAPLDVQPALLDYRPLVTVVQQEPCHRSDRGWLSTVVRPGAMPLNGRPARLSPILVTVYSVVGLELVTISDETLFAAKGFALDVRHPSMIRSSTTTYTTPSGEKVRAVTYELDVTGASAEVPLVLVEPERSAVGAVVKSALHEGFDRMGDSSARVALGYVEPSGSVETAGVVERTWRVTLAFESHVGDHSDHQTWLSRWLTALVGEMLDANGRIVEARVLDGGRAMRDGQAWGSQAVVVGLTTRSRKA